MNTRLYKSTLRIALAVALSILLHSLILWTSPIKLPRYEEPLPQLTAKLEPLPKLKARPVHKRKSKPQVPVTPEAARPDVTPVVEAPTPSEPEIIQPLPEVKAHSLPIRARLNFDV